MKATISKTENIKGTIEISGSKNATLPLLACALLTKEMVILKNVPKIKDIEIMVEILKKLKIKAYFNHKDLVIHRKRKLKCNSNLLIPEMKKLRGSTYLIAAMIALKKKIKSFYPGGCKLGARPIDYHLRGFEQFGIINQTEGEVLTLKRKKLSGNIIELPGISMGATINMLIVSALANGQTVIKNPSFEPEVLETIKFLNLMGADIRIEGKIFRINGVKQLFSVCHKVMFDRIEAGSYLLLGASFPNTMLTLTNVSTKHLVSILDVLNKIGVEVIADAYKITIKTKQQLQAVDVIADIYPGFPTDLQQILASSLLNVDGTSKIEDSIFPKRTSHIAELIKLGAVIEQHQDYYLVKKSILKGCILEGTDLRGTFALVLAAAHADGTTVINNIDNIIRGYENLEYKLNKINVKIKISN